MFVTMRNWTLLTLIIALVACDKPSGIDSLYQHEQQELQSSYQALTQWSEKIVAMIADQDDILDNALLLMEQQDSDNEAELEALMLRAQSQKDEINQSFFAGQKLQATLFVNVYKLMGKLDAGAVFCQTTPAYESIQPTSLVDPATLPELEQAYATSLQEGNSMLRASRPFSCETFLPEYQRLVKDIELKIDTINRLMYSLAS